MESISVKKTTRTRVYDNPLRNPISNISQWNDLKAQDYENNNGNEFASFRHAKKASNRLLKPISNLQEWRTLIAEDMEAAFTKTNSKELDGEVVASNPLLKPISNLQEWRDLIGQESLTEIESFNSKEFDEKNSSYISLSSWLTS